VDRAERPQLLPEHLPLVVAVVHISRLIFWPQIAAALQKAAVQAVAAGLVLLSQLGQTVVQAVVAHRRQVVVAQAGLVIMTLPDQLRLTCQALAAMVPLAHLLGLVVVAAEQHSSPTIQQPQTFR